MIEKDVNGLSMGILSDGTPYLTLRALARLCGVDHTAISRLASNWNEEKLKPRGQKILTLLRRHRHDGGQLHLVTIKNGTEVHAYPDNVCMALLEHYAFDADLTRDVALSNYRTLAAAGLKVFIYAQCAYDPNNHIPDSWKNFHARVLLNDQLPVGFFSVFCESCTIVVHMIQGGCHIDSHTVPDISVGKHWSKFWADNDFDTKYSARIKHPHTYPEWYPQSQVTPEAWVYPVAALGDFRIWIYKNYIPQFFPKYIATKVDQDKILPSMAELLLETMAKKGLPAN